MGRNNYQSSGEGWSEVGCMVIIGLFALPYILQSLFVALMPFFLIGIVGFVAYRLYVYDRNTGNITNWFEEQFKINQKEPRKTVESQQKPKENTGLPEPQEDLLNQIKMVREQMEELKLENLTLKENQERYTQEALERFSNQKKIQTKKDVLNELFGEDSTDYARSDEFEAQDYSKAVEKQKDELEIRSIKQEMKERLWETEKQSFEIRMEAKEDLGNFKEEVRGELMRVHEKLQQLEHSIITLRAYCDARFNQMEIMFHNAIAEVKETISRLRTELKDEMANMKVNFGKEILRIDKQQMQIVSKMEQYEAQIKKFTYDIMKIKVDAEKFQMRGEAMLNRANVAYQKHQTIMHRMSKDLEVGLKEVSLHKKDFALTAGRAKLLMDKTSNDQYLALKDIAMERVGVEMLRQDHTQRVAVEHQKMNNLLQEKRHLEDKIRLNFNNQSKVQQLQHSLFMTQENLQHSQNRHNLLRQEQSVFRKLSK